MKKRDRKRKKDKERKRKRKEQRERDRLTRFPLPFSCYDRLCESERSIIKKGVNDKEQKDLESSKNSYPFARGSTSSSDLPFRSHDLPALLFFSPSFYFSTRGTYLGWLFGPFLSFPSQYSGINILSWCDCDVPMLLLLRGGVTRTALFGNKFD